MINRIETSLKNKTIKDFSADSNLLDATLMRLHFIGENVKSVSFEIKKKYRNLRWRKFARLRNLIGHKYSIVDKEIIWDVVSNSLPEFKKEINLILNTENWNSE